MTPHQGDTRTGVKAHRDQFPRGDFQTEVERQQALKSVDE